MLSTIDLACLPHTGLRRVSAACSQNLHHRGTRGAAPDPVVRFTGSQVLVQPVRLQLPLLDPQVSSELGRSGDFLSLPQNREPTSEWRGRTRGMKWNRRPFPPPDHGPLL